MCYKSILGFKSQVSRLDMTKIGITKNSYIATQKSKQILEKMLLVGLESSPPKLLTKADLDEVRKIVKQRISERKKNPK